MKHFKRLIACLMAGVMIFTLAACGQKSVPQEPQSAPQQQEPPAESSSPSEVPQTDGNQSAEPSAQGSKTLVVYYSASGNTAAVAGYIAEATGGDLFEIIPTEPYTDADLNWTDANSRVSREHDDPTLRAVELTADTAENWDDYDTVFIGYPIWWGIAAWPVNGFVQSNDFIGKTVIPFCTSASSGLGQSADLLEELAGSGTWLDGQRFSERPSASDIERWADSLGL